MEQRDIDQLLDMALADHQNGRLAEAEKRYNQVISIQPDNADARHFLGLAAYQSGREEEAITLMAASVERNPYQPSFHNNLGVVYKSVERFEDAAACFRRAVDLAPDFTEALNNLGLVLREEGKLKEAIEVLHQAIAISSNDWELHNTLGTVFAAQKDFTAARTRYERALELAPGTMEVLNNLAIVHRNTGNPQAAISCYEQALESSPDHATTISNLVWLLSETCDWHRLAHWSGRLDRLTTSGNLPETAPAEAPLTHMRRCDDPVRNLDLARRRADRAERRVASKRMEPARLAPAGDSPRAPLKIGYLSSDFRDHPVGHLMANVLDCHDHRKLHVTCYGYGSDDNSAVRRQITESCDNFVVLNDQDHVGAAQIIRDDGIQILVDLNGHTAEARLEIPALRAAPVQASFLGYPGTIGGKFIDYIIADPMVAPFDHASYFTEKIVHLPQCVLPGGPPAGPDLDPPPRNTLGLPESGIVFGSFNHSTKFDPGMFGVWMTVLHAVPDSVLWLSTPADLARSNLLRFAEEHGIGRDRLVFADRVADRQEYGRRLGAADLMLDTRYYNGHATTLDALSAGVPVIAYTGVQYASRVSASALITAGIPELITWSLDDYEALCIELATNEPRRQALRQQLIEARESSPLFDPRRYTRGLEAAYETMWQKFATVDGPQSFAVEPQ